jgi:hypothetical protein
LIQHFIRLDSIIAYFILQIVRGDFCNNICQQETLALQKKGLRRPFMLPSLPPRAIRHVRIVCSSNGDRMYGQNVGEVYATIGRAPILHGGITVAMAVATGRFHQPLDLGLGESGAEVLVGCGDETALPPAPP